MPHSTADHFGHATLRTRRMAVEMAQKLLKELRKTGNFNGTRNRMWMIGFIEKTRDFYNVRFLKGPV